MSVINQSFIQKSNGIFATGSGYLGDNSTNASNTYKNIPFNMKKVAKSPNGQTFILAEDGTIWGVGKEYSASSNGPKIFRDKLGWGQATTSFVQVDTDSWLDIAFLERTFVGIKADGTLWGWGDSSRGALGKNIDTIYSSPIQIGTKSDFVQISTNGHTVIVMDNQGRAYGFGDNRYGQVQTGYGDYIKSPEVSVVPSSFGKIIGVHSGRFNTFLLKDDETLWVKGWNTFGFKGNGSASNENMSTPIQIGINSAKKVVSTNTGAALVLTKNGEIYTCGTNANGELGDGTTTNRYTYQKIVTNEIFVDISSGDGFFTALTSQGELFAWGKNDQGQLGDGTTTNASTPEKVQEGVVALLSTDRYYVFNNIPSVVLTGPTPNQTLYENDTLNIAGTATDTDNGNAVTIRYQVNASTARAIKAFVSTGAAESFSKALTFKGGSLYDGETLIASNLTDGVAHTLKVWATDDQGGQSTIIERTFYVVPNRAPSLTVNAPVIEGLIDSDTFEINGTYGDQDGNDVTVSYRINGGNSVQVASGANGEYDFIVKFGQLVVGTNTITVEVADSYGAKTSKTVRLNKTEVKTDILKSTSRYRLLPPTGTASEVLVWVQRGAQLTVNASVSMTDDGEAESFEAMAVTNTSPLDSGLVEDEFYHDAGAAKSRIILQLDLERDSVDVDDSITLISGVF